MALIMSGLMAAMPLSVTTAVTAGAEDAVTEEAAFTEPVGGVYNGIMWSFDGETLVFEAKRNYFIVMNNESSPWLIYKDKVKKSFLKKVLQLVVDVLS